jgi:integrase
MDNTATEKGATLSLFERSDMARRRGQKLGELIERGGMWGVRYYVDTAEVDPETGKPKRERLIEWLGPSKGPLAKGKREVNRYRLEFMQRIDQFTVRPSSMRTLREFVEQRFYPDVVQKLKRNSQLYYRSTFRHILPDLGSVALRDITPGRVQACINKAAAKGLTKTVRHIMAVMSAVLNHAKAMQWYAGDLPTEGIRLPAAQETERRALTWDQVASIANNLPEQESTLVVLLVLTGLRIGEAMGLRWKWVNLTQDMRIVNGQVIPPLSIGVRENYVRGAYQTLKTAKSVRNVPLPAWFLPRMWRLLARGEWIGPDDPVFVGETGRPLDEHNVAARKLKPACVAAGLGTPAIPKSKSPDGKAKRAQSWVSWHVFRHTNATLADMAGFSVTERQRILGHASEAMTMHYTKSDLERLRPRLEAMVDGSKLLQ